MCFNGFSFADNFKVIVFQRTFFIQSGNCSMKPTTNSYCDKDRKRSEREKGREKEKEREREKEKERERERKRERKRERE